MSKALWKSGTMVYPAPAVLVSCGTMEKPNLITVAWTGTICTNPAMAYISIRPERYSYDLIKDSKVFAINLTTKKMVRATDFCGVKSGRDLDKFKATGLTPIKGQLIDAPIVKESPLTIECEVTEIIKLGSHDMFLAKVLGITIEESLLDNTGRFRLDKAELVAYSHGSYYSLSEALGTFGYSIKKKTKKKHK